MARSHTVLIQTSSHSLIESDNVQSSRLRFNVKFEIQLIIAFGIRRRKLANGKYSFCEYFNSFKKSVKLFGANDDIILGAFLLNFKFILWSPFSPLLWGLEGVCFLLTTNQLKKIYEDPLSQIKRNKWIRMKERQRKKDKERNIRKNSTERKTRRRKRRQKEAN